MSLPVWGTHGNCRDTLLHLAQMYVYTKDCLLFNPILNNTKMKTIFFQQSIPRNFLDTIYLR